MYYTIMKKIIYSGKYLNIKEPYKPLWFLGIVFFGASFLLFQTRMPIKGFEQSSVEFWVFAIITGIVIEIVLYAVLFSHHNFMIEKNNSKIYFIQDFKKIEIHGFEKWWGYQKIYHWCVNIIKTKRTIQQAKLSFQYY